MSEVPGPLAVIILNAGGLFLLAVSQERHWRVVAGLAALTALRQRGLRALGLALLLAGLLTGVRTEGAGFGAVLWLFVAAGTVVIVAMLLAWLDARQRRGADRRWPGH